MITRIDRDIEQRNRLKEYRALLAQKYLSKSWEQWQHETSHSIKLWAFPLWLQGYTVGHWQPAVGDIKGVPINVDPSIAWRHRFIQLMPTHEFNLLPADIDRPDSHDHIIRLCEAGELTFPNYITINRETGHAQCAWVLAHPVHRQTKFRKCPVSQKALGEYRRVRMAIWRLLGADMYFNVKGIMRNPMHSEQQTFFATRQKPYTLAELKTKTVRDYISDQHIDTGGHIGFRQESKYGAGRRSSPETARVARMAQAKSVLSRRTSTRKRDKLIVSRRQLGFSLKEISLEFGIAISTVRQTLKRFGARPPQLSAKAWAQEQNRQQRADRRREVVELRG